MPVLQPDSNFEAQELLSLPQNVSSTRYIQSFNSEDQYIKTAPVLLKLIEKECSDLTTKKSNSMGQYIHSR